MAEKLLTDAAPASGTPGAPRLAWPVAVDADQAQERVRARLGRAGASAALQARLYLHPMLAVELAWHRRRREGAAHALVDLVGGRAFVVEPWTEVPFVPVEELAELDGCSARDIRDGAARFGPPVARVTVDEAVGTARRLLTSVLLRRRRLGSGSSFELRRDPLVVGKPNWWVTGSVSGRPVEVVVDAVSGRHYAFRG